MSEEEDTMLLLCKAYMQYNAKLHEARRDVHDALLEEAWRIAVRTRHYLTSQCLDTPCEAAWMTLYTCGHDHNFLNATSLTRYCVNVSLIMYPLLTKVDTSMSRAAFPWLLSRFSSFYYIPKPSTTGRPPKLRYHHQALGLVLCFYVGSMEQSTLCMLFGVPTSTLSRTLK
ncbi:hypothetical protein PF005_g18552 [Phytophthora fragariae]|uniref:DDE Tnp4 domain-containing protein n=2 Tax=Phytophthora TaxID=4783 RepID=A0A6A3WW61_9STRA|nr:hypothetical protein PF009_g19530 [Phytophthora fragariae]KAE8992634.1 hypothetical protein PF011_g17478 [Phytophthora fragariae]KAE9092534.1 hypothetical protein PF010_g17810 [Phytophthora fragariae]KAE9123098.1 hypothetical protein PF006_g17498 [Phytophthora fragariae]KAE9192197.1 hypothetical protein PF005_g18552 [Phytophthora fragariae]